MPLHRARGFSLAVVLVVLALVMIGIVAALGLSRLGRSSNDANSTITKLGAAQTALEQFASASHRLPCPANPAQDTGDEVRPTPTSNDCTFPEGTIPWKTIGLRRDDSFDAWGYKLSYRVDRGAAGTNKGSLVQPEGASMVNCDLEDANPVAVTSAGLCASGVDVYANGTLDTAFLAGKGLTLDDLGTARSDVAYLIISHGSTGLGAYTASNVRREMPTGDELLNTMATGPFTIKAFSDPGIAATNALHFDDVIVYRTVADLIRRIGLYARDWPEGGKASTLFSDLGLSGSGNLGTSTFTTTAGVTFSSFNNGSASNFSYATDGSLQAIGGSGGGSFALGMTEFIRVDLNGLNYSSFALTMTNFGFASAAASPRDREQVDIRFFASGVQVGGTVTRQACKVDGSTYATVLVDAPPSQKYDRVEIQPKAFSQTTAASSQVYIAELAACASTIVCTTSVADATNTCLPAALSTTSFSPASVTVGTSSAFTLTLSNAPDIPATTGANAAQSGIEFTYTLPSGLAFTGSPTVGSGCTATSIAFAGSNTQLVASGMAMGENVATCTITGTVATSTAGSYSDSTASITKTANVRNALAGSTLTVTAP